MPVVALRGKRHALPRGDIGTRGSRRAGASAGLVDRLGRKLGKTILSEYATGLSLSRRTLSSQVLDLSADAADLFHPSAEGTGRVMNAALRAAGLEIDDIYYVNAHGSGTRTNDETEVRAMKLVFGRDRLPPASSTKGITGHALGAAGAIEAVATILAMRNQLAPPNRATHGKLRWAGLRFRLHPKRSAPNENSGRAPQLVRVRRTQRDDRFPARG